MHSQTHDRQARLTTPPAVPAPSSARMVVVLAAVLLALAVAWLRLPASSGGFASMERFRSGVLAQMASALPVAEFVRGNHHQRRIAFTFDDGPHVSYTEALLAELRAANVRVTFFVVGRMADAAPHLVQAELADGHEVGTHTYEHINMAKASESQLEADLTTAKAHLAAITGAEPTLLRPPGGDHDWESIHVADRLGLTTVLWTDDPGDYDPATPASVIVERTLRRASPGGIILMHDGSLTGLEALPTIFAALRAKGYEFVTVSELMRGLPARPSRRSWTNRSAATGIATAIAATVAATVATAAAR